MLASFGLFAEAGANLKDAHGLAPEAEELGHEGVQMGGQHGPQTFMTADPKNLLAEGMRGSDGHLLQQSFGEEERGHHLHKPVFYQRIHQDPF